MGNMLKNKPQKWIICLILVLIVILIAKVSYYRYEQKENSWESYYADLYSTQYQDDFINEIKSSAQKNHQKNGLLPSITIAQAILESEWGQSDLAQKANNLFGIKGAYNGDYVMMETDEFFDNDYTTISDKFKKYPNVDDSIQDHMSFLEGATYRPVLAAKNYLEAAVALQKGGYATDPKYADKLIELIEQFKLYNYDS